MKRITDSVFLGLKIAVAGTAVAVFGMIPGAVLILAVAAAGMYAVAVAATTIKALVVRFLRPTEEEKPALKLLSALSLHAEN